MKDRTPIYCQNSKSEKRIRLMFGQPLPGHAFVFAQDLREVQDAISKTPPPDTIIFFLSGISETEKALITTILNQAKPTAVSTIVIFDDAVDLSVFANLHVDVLLSSKMKETRLSEILLSFLGNKKTKVPEGNEIGGQDGLTGFMESTSVGVWCFKPDVPVPTHLPEGELIEACFNSTCVACNTAYANMLGMPSGALIGLKLRGVLPETAENIGYLRTFIKNGFKIIDGISHEITPHGEEKYFSNSFIATINNGMLIEAWGTQVDVSETKKALGDLRETERKAATMIDNFPGIVYQCTDDIHRAMKFISKNALKLTGYPYKDFLDNKNISYSDIILPEDTEPVIMKIQEAVENNSPFQMEYRIRTKTNKIKWVWEQGRQVQVKGGTGNLLEGLIIDITEIKLSKIRLEIMRNIGEAHNKTKDLAELIELIEMELGKTINTRNFLIALYDEKSDTFSLPYMKDEKDFFKELPAGKTISSLVIKRNKPMLLTRADIDRLEGTGEIERVGSPAKCWLGVPLQVEDKVIGIIVLQDYEDENAIGPQEKELLGFVSTQVAATIFKKQADEEIKRLYQSIQQSPVSVVISDMDEKVIYVNQKFIDVTGYTREEAIGSTPELIKSGKTPGKTYENLRKTLDLGKEFQGEFLNRKKNGEFFWEHVSISPVKNDIGEITHYIAVKEDITTRKKMEQDLLEAKEKAEGSDRLKTAFLTNMSHEIRTPMNAIIGFTEMLGEVKYLKEEREKFSTLIIDNGRKLLGIIDDIIDIAKIEAGQLDIKTDRCSANKILFDNYYSFRELRSRYGKEHIEIIARQHKEDQNFIFSSDPLRINQVISNLMNNALKYTNEGSVELGYRILEKGQGYYIDFYVKDTGIGIDADNSENIFDRFRQVDNSSTRETGGTGLGLAISKNIANLLGGDITLESTSGQGSSFHFTIPFVEIVQDRFEPQIAEPATEKADWANKKILVAEDEDSNFHLLEIMLRKTKVQLTRAYNGKEAIDLIRGGKEVDLILMDVRMPLMDGYEATALIKKFNPEIPIVAQTAYALSGDRETCLKAGCDGYISKPLNRRELYKEISKFIG
ncbi:MAG: hypothetical protein B6D64_07040 [Bacteroidetes bacterium 4484_276]|nr:MAG: hypothetical protein B6D64_07040 [Bacteroidetes bacterium 4484_276]